jgi:hypothetical protein
VSLFKRKAKKPSGTRVLDLERIRQLNPVDEYGVPHSRMFMVLLDYMGLDVVVDWDNDVVTIRKRRET